MKVVITLFLLSLFVINAQSVFAQNKNENKIEFLINQKAKITEQEKAALKLEVQEINQRLEKAEITNEEAKLLKESAAKKRAMNIDNRISIIDNKIKLIERNGTNLLQLDTLNHVSQIEIGFGGKNLDVDRILGIRYNKNRNRYIPKRDKRTSSDLMIGLGFHNNVIQGEKFFDSPHSVLGSRYFELGYLWKTRILKNSNSIRLNYGIIYENKGLKSDNQVFAEVTVLGESNDIVLSDVADVYVNDDNVQLKKSKFRQDAFIFPVYLEFGPSTKRENGDYFRYSTNRKFKFGIGAYLGFPVKNIQKIKFVKGQEGNSFLVNNRPFGTFGNSLNTGGLWGWSMYAGRGDTTVVFKLEGSDNLLSGAQGSRKNVSLGLRFDL